jgi:hypothetical protein
MSLSSRCWPWRVDVGRDVTSLLSYANNDAAESTLILMSLLSFTDNSTAEAKLTMWSKRPSELFAIETVFAIEPC